MQYCSTRNPAHRLSLAPAIEQGLAPDGGLYVPLTLPRLTAAALADDVDDLPALAARVIAPFAQLRVGPVANTPETFALSVIRKAGPADRSRDREADRDGGSVPRRSFLSSKAESARAPPPSARDRRQGMNDEGIPAR